MEVANTEIAHSLLCICKSCARRVVYCQRDALIFNCFITHARLLVWLGARHLDLRDFAILPQEL